MKVNKNSKIKVAILFGGKSSEHEVSIMSARNVFEALDKDKYDITAIGITKAGKWILVEPRSFLHSGDTDILEKLLLDGGSMLSLTPANKEFSFMDSLDKERRMRFDVVFPVLHGPHGEDGTVQGLFKIMNVPFVGPGVLGSAIGMDKDVTKRLLRDAGIPIAKYKVLYAHSRKKSSFLKIKKELGLPLFVKPANLGSSVGISRVTSMAEFDAALDMAFKYDSKVVVEEYVEGREIECAVIGNEKPEASLPGEVIPNKTKHGFYSYDAKYLDGDGASFQIPANLPKKLVKNIRNIALWTFKSLCCEGMSRVDMFLKKDGTLVVNEINTIPGFTSVSMYSKLWEASGISYSKLIDRLIEFAIERYDKEQKLLTSVAKRV